MVDKVLAVLSFAMLAAFAGIIVGFVPDIDLGLVFLFTLVLCAYDFWKTTMNAKGNGGGGDAAR